MQVSKFSLRNGFRPYLLSFRGICREAAQTQLAKVLRQSNDMAPTARKEKQYCSGDQRRGAEGGSQIQSLNRGEEQRSRGREARSRGDEQREGVREQRRRAGRERQGRGGLTFGLAGADWPAAGGSGRREQTPAGRKAPSGEGRARRGGAAAGNCDCEAGTREAARSCDCEELRLRVVPVRPFAPSPSNLSRARPPFPAPDANRARASAGKKPNRRRSPLQRRLRLLGAAEAPPRRRLPPPRLPPRLGVRLPP